MDMSQRSREEKLEINPKILMDEKSWKNCKSNQEIVMDEELVQNVVMDEESVENIVMDEELVQNVVMDEESVQNIVMDATIDPKVVMDLSIFKTGGWNILQPSSQKLWEEFIDGNGPWLSIGTPSRDSSLMMQYWERRLVSSDQHVKELMPLREGLHVTTHCYMRQHFADRHSASWRESTRTKFMRRADMLM